MHQEKSPSSDKQRPKPIAFKKRTYKLKNISYMQLSLMYIALIVLTAVVGLLLIATCIAKDQYIAIVLSVILVTGIIASLYRIGIQYGQYGLEIIIGKFFQRKHIKNDFPRIERQLLADQQLFPNQTLIKKKENQKKENQKKENQKKENQKKTDESDSSDSSKVQQSKSEKDQ